MDMAFLLFDDGHVRLPFTTICYCRLYDFFVVLNNTPENDFYAYKANLPHGFILNEWVVLSVINFAHFYKYHSLNLFINDFFIC